MGQRKVHNAEPTAPKIDRFLSPALPQRMAIYYAF
jgi:hypothetical protein